METITFQHLSALATALSKRLPATRTVVSDRGAWPSTLYILPDSKDAPIVEFKPPALDIANAGWIVWGMQALCGLGDHNALGSQLGEDGQMGVLTWHWGLFDHGWDGLAYPTMAQAIFWELWRMLRCEL